MKKIALILSSVLITTSLFAQVAPKKVLPEEYSWKILQEAKVVFEKNDYSKSINLALKAKENRKAESRWESYILENSLSPFAVRRVGEEFDSVLPVLEERQQTEAINLINKYINLYGKERFKNSVYNMKSWIEKKSVYPEADYLIGKIYQVEGEYKSAYEYFEKARKESDFLDIPDQVYDILYSMADLANQQEKYEEYEQVLLLILDKDENFKDKVLRTAMLKLIDGDSKNSVDKFFSLFRAESPMTLNALYRLGKVYDSRGEAKNSLFCSALGSVEGFTHILTSISERDPGFEYSSFGDFLAKINSYEDIMEWCTENNFWDYLLDFGEKTAYRGDVIFSNSLLKILSINAPVNYYRSAAENKIVK